MNDKTVPMFPELEPQTTVAIPPIPVKRSRGVPIPVGSKTHRINGYAVRALSILQPWAWLIVNDLKDFENRSRVFPFILNQKFLVHAGLGGSRDQIEDDYESAQMLIRAAKLKIKLPKSEELQRGGFVGVTKCSGINVANTKRLSPWHMGGLGYWVKDGRPIDFIPYTGAMGFFEPRLLPEQWAKIFPQ